MEYSPVICKAQMELALIAILSEVIKAQKNK
jgi:hypothetical protein